MKRALRLLLWPGSLILLVVASLGVNAALVVIALRQENQTVTPIEAPTTEAPE